MPVDSLWITFLLLILAAALGFFFARFSSKTKEPPASRTLSKDYFKGLNFLLNEQPDKAIEIFVKMVEVDNETVETHFALGSLFRRRGEVDRAIRIHQNIIARPNLNKTQRDQALFALGEDYMRAGLFDRAEKLFEQLADKSTHRGQALEKLVRIYEQQKDWRQAIAAHQKLDAFAVQPQNNIAHYYCELAEAALQDNDQKLARLHLRKAQATDAPTVRGPIMRARIACEMADYRTAIRLYRRVIEQNRAFMSEIGPEVLKSFIDSDNADGFDKLLDALVRKDPEAIADIAYAVVLHDDVETPAAIRCLREYIQGNDTLRSLLEALDTTGTLDLGEDRVILSIRNILRRLVETHSRYSCRQCGFSAQVLYWQCPSCKTWDAIRPVTRFRIDAILSAGAATR